MRESLSRGLGYQVLMLLNLDIDIFHRTSDWTCPRVRRYYTIFTVAFKRQTLQGTRAQTHSLTLYRNPQKLVCTLSGQHTSTRKQTCGIALYWLVVGRIVSHFHQTIQNKNHCVRIRSHHGYTWQRYRYTHIMQAVPNPSLTAEPIRSEKSRAMRIFPWLITTRSHC